MRVTLVRACIVLAVVLLGLAPAHGYQRVLSDDAIRAAIEYGKSRKGKDIVDLRSPYMPVISRGFLMRGFVFIETPWLFVASRAHTAAAEYREIDVSAAQQALALRGAPLQITAVVLDEQDRFWINSHAVLLQSGKTIQPIRKQSSFYKVVSCRTTPCTLSALMIFDFGDDELNTAQDADILLNIFGGRTEFRITVRFGSLPESPSAASAPSPIPPPAPSATPAPPGGG